MAALFVLVVTLASAGVVLYACFCRLTKTTRAAFGTVRAALVALAGAAACVIAAPILWQWAPDAAHAAVLLAVASYLVATRRNWAHGVPHWYVRPTR